MHVNFGPKGILQIDDARLIFKNFSGTGSKFNREGDRNFAVVIPNEEIKDALVNDVNEMGVGWNVKIKAPREEGDEPFMFLPVKIKFTDRGPSIYLKTGDRVNRLDEETIDLLDNIEIESVDLDIRPYDDEFSGRAFRSAYLQAIHVTQKVDRFQARYAADEYPEE